MPLATNFTGDAYLQGGEQWPANRRERVERVYPRGGVLLGIGHGFTENIYSVGEKGGGLSGWSGNNQGLCEIHQWSHTLARGPFAGDCYRR